jgi:NAD(P)-dependent dehydrogenase (short-subunit alcohol dehydrogenase family)
MKKNQFGKIVHVSSASGKKASGRDSAYAASKAGLIRLVDSIKEEAKEFKININCILPTIIDTHANRLSMPSADYSGWVKPLDLARLIVFLCSENSKVINGEAIKTSGYA